MNLLDTASLVVTPNGYKASKLYSIIPSDGSGDMTFARTGDTATRVNSSGLIETVLANKPRLDYFNSTCPKLLLEPQRTNLTLYSEQLDNAYWTKTGTTITANAIASPSGSVNADLIVENTANSDHAIFDVVTYFVSGTTYTTSFYAKANGRTKIDLTSANSGTCPSGRFDLTAVTAVATGTSFNPKIESVGNGWYRCSVSKVAPNNGLDVNYYMMVQSFGTNTYLGNGTSGVYLWGMQTEAGAYATSYIPTTTASVTRNAETCRKTSATALIGQTEGTIFLDLNGLNLLNFNRFFSLSSDNWLDNSIRFDYGTVSHKITIEGVFSGAASFSFNTSNAYSLNSRLKIALAYKLNDVVLYVNGVQTNNITSTGSIPACSVIAFNELYLFSSGGGEKVNYNSAALWKTRLTNQELATLTTT